jgi:hypothetical protein
MTQDLASRIVISWLGCTTPKAVGRLVVEEIECLIWIQ